MANKKLDLDRQPLTSPEELSQVKDSYSLDVMAMVEDRMATAIGMIPEAYISMTDKELFKTCNPSPIDYALRTAFWREYDRHYLNGSVGRIKTTDFCAGVCTPSYFYSLIKRPATLLWIIKPKQTYHREMESILSRGIERLWEIIEIPIYDENQKVDHRLASIVLAAIKQVEDRVQGMAVQRTQSVIQNINTPQPALTGKSMDDLNKKIHELESAIHANAAPGRRDSGHQALPPSSKEPQTLELQPLQPWNIIDSESAE